MTGGHTGFLIEIQHTELHPLANDIRSVEADLKKAIEDQDWRLVERALKTTLDAHAIANTVMSRQSEEAQKCTGGGK